MQTVLRHWNSTLFRRAPASKNKFTINSKKFQGKSYLAIILIPIRIINDTNSDILRRCFFFLCDDIGLRNIIRKKIRQKGSYYSLDCRYKNVDGREDLSRPVKATTVPSNTSKRSIGSRQKQWRQLSTG